MPMVTTTLRPTSIMVKRMYFPSNGSANDVDGMISDISKKNMTCDKRIVMQSATFSPESAGK
jgi:hypothetical protein